jgi:hypothetical protein
MLQAKSVIKDRFWILRLDDRKIGEVERDEQGYHVRIGDRKYYSKTLPRTEQGEPIRFESVESSAGVVSNLVHGFDAGCDAYNIMWDARRRVPLFSKSAKSRSMFAAGWYAIQQHRAWRITRNPKSILLDRYRYQGPFHSRDQARGQVMT